MDWVLATVGVTGVALAGQKRTRGYGWMIGIAVQVIWVAYALMTEQYGFILSAAAFGIVNTVNFITWYREYSAWQEVMDERHARTRAIEIIEKERE